MSDLGEVGLSIKTFYGHPAPWLVDSQFCWQQVFQPILKPRQPNLIVPPRTSRKHKSSQASVTVNNFSHQAHGTTEKPLEVLKVIHRFLHVFLDLVSENLRPTQLPDLLDNAWTSLMQPSDSSREAPGRVQTSTAGQGESFCQLGSG